MNGGASIIIDSSSESASVVTGSGSVIASQFFITGSPADLATSNGQFIAGIEAGATPTLDPLAYLPAPDTSALGVQSSSQYKLTGTASASISPGVYVGGIAVTGGTLTLSPGIYYMQGGGFSVSGTGSVAGSGVLIYNAPNSTSDIISITGSGSVVLSPPTTGIYQGITLFQDRTSSAPITLNGNGGLNMTGTIYAARAQLGLSGSGTNPIGGQYIVYDVTLTGSGNVNMTWTSAGTSRTRRIGLVE